MDIVFQFGQVSAEDVHERLPDSPTYSAAGATVKLREDKGLVRDVQKGRVSLDHDCHPPQKTKS